MLGLIVIVAVVTKRIENNVVEVILLNNEFKKGDICVYHYADGNGSVSIVKVIDIVDSDKSKIQCIQVISDKSGNGWFEYMLGSDATMTASNKYLHKIYALERQKEATEMQVSLSGIWVDEWKKQKAEVERLQKLLDDKCDHCIERERRNGANIVFDMLERRVTFGKTRDLYVKTVDINNIKKDLIGEE